MRNCLILGSGRSGSSTAAGILESAGYYFGDELIEPAAQNPKGFFESAPINRLNQRLMAHLCDWRAVWRGKPVTAGQHAWAAGMPSIKPQHSLAAQLARWRYAGAMRDIVSRATAPYCFKDPRFSYTLPFWRPHLRRDTVYIVTFRHPATTAASVAKFFKRDADNPAMIQMGIDHFIWSYHHVLETHRHEGKWLFVHYDQMLSGEALPRLEEFLEVKLSGDFVEPNLHRSKDQFDVPQRAMDIYNQLCGLAGFTEKSA